MRGALAGDSKSFRLSARGTALAGRWVPAGIWTRQWFARVPIVAAVQSSHGGCPYVLRVRIFSIHILSAVCNGRILRMADSAGTGLTGTRIWVPTGWRTWQWRTGVATRQTQHAQSDEREAHSLCYHRVTVLVPSTFAPYKQGGEVSLVWPCQKL